MTIELTEVTKTYGRVLALAPTTLRLDGGVVGLLGPNGAGKTTMLRLVATAMPPTRGRIRVSGHEVTAGRAARVEARRRIGYVPQEVVFPRGMSVFGFVDYVAVLKEWRTTAQRHEEVRRVLAQVGLLERSNRRVRALSGGQRRRLAIAQGLLGDPDVLVLDEPTTGLDPEQRADLRAVLSGLRGTVLISTHQTEDVSALCDRVVVIDAGRVRFDGTVQDLLARAEGRVHVGDRASEGAVASWRTGTGMVRSVGGVPDAGARGVPASVEDAYLLMRHEPAGGREERHAY